MEAQAPICPFCKDDHSSARECHVKDLKKEILITDIINIAELYSLSELDKNSLIRAVRYL